MLEHRPAAQVQRSLSESAAGALRAAPLSFRVRAGSPGVPSTRIEFLEVQGTWNRVFDYVTVSGHRKVSEGRFGSHRLQTGTHSRGARAEGL